MFLFLRGALINSNDLFSSHLRPIYGVPISTIYNFVNTTNEYPTNVNH